MIFEFIIAGLFLMLVWWLFKSGVIWGVLAAAIGLITIVVFFDF